MAKTKIIKAKEIKETKTQRGKKKAAEVSATPKNVKRVERKKYNIDDIIDAAIERTNFKCGGGLSFQPMLAEKYDGTQNIENWLMSEKLDGIRCIWDGQRLYSRNGKLFYPPKWFKEGFPSDIVLDGELFLNRKDFSRTSSIVMKQYEHDEWKEIKYIIFDAPCIKGDFNQRLKILESKLSQVKSPYIELLKQEICKDKEHLEAKMKEIIQLNGEGVIIRDPKSEYENRRVKTMLKVKEFHDAEATVLSHHKGTGRLAHTMGAIEVKNDDGIIFRIGSGFDDSERAKPPKIGSRVTYRYFELSKDNVPRFPTFLRIRKEE